MNLEKHGAKSKKPITKDHLLYDSIYIKFQDRKTYKDQKQIIHFMWPKQGNTGEQQLQTQSFF
jgi:hypothetical protein